MEPQIVIVDDDKIYNRVFIESFKKNNYKKVSSFDAAEVFLKYLSSPDTNLPRVVIIDYLMPTFSGFQLLAYLKRNSLYCNIKVIIYSSLIDENIKRICLKAGALAYIQKKSSIEDLNRFCCDIMNLAIESNSCIFSAAVC